MKVAQLYTYPIKSLRGTPLQKGRLTPRGLPYDRTFMLLKIDRNEDGSEEKLVNMQVPRFMEMGLFGTEIVPGLGSDGHDEGEGQARVVVTYNPPTPTPPPGPGTGTEPNNSIRTEAGTETGTGTKKLEIPLHPPTRHLSKLAINLHNSRTTAYNMGDAYNAWFSACFGFPVVLAYLGDGERGVLGSFAPGPRSRGPAALGLGILGWVGVLLFPVCAVALKYILDLELAVDFPRMVICTCTTLILACAGAGWVHIKTRGHSQKAGKPNNHRLTFSDCAAYLVVSTTSVANVSARLPGSEEMDVTKFRPNIVISGAAEAFEEDFWAGLAILPSPEPLSESKSKSETRSKEEGLRFEVTANCVRCQSINVDYATGKAGSGESGRVLKKLMKDRRVDRGARYSPVFGRYAFLGQGQGQEMRVGDEVVVERINSERTVYDWPGLSN